MNDNNTMDAQHAKMAFMPYASSARGVGGGGQGA